MIKIKDIHKECIDAVRAGHDTNRKISKHLGLSVQSVAGRIRYANEYGKFISKTRVKEDVQAVDVFSWTGLEYEGGLVVVKRKPDESEQSYDLLDVFNRFKAPSRETSFWRQSTLTTGQ